MQDKSTDLLIRNMVMMIRIDKSLNALLINQEDVGSLIVCVEHPRSRFVEIRAKLDGLIQFESKNKAVINQDMLFLINNGNFVKNYNLLMQNIWKQDHLNELTGDISLDVYWDCKLDQVNIKDQYKITIFNNETYYICKSGNSILDQAINKNIKDIPSGCRNGGCGICLLRILDGSYMCKEMSQKKINQEDNCYLSCKVYPLSDLVVEIPNRKILASQ